MIINGIECITLAHGIEGDPVASHPYFGSRAVADDILAMQSDNNGCVVLQAGSCTQRDHHTGLVCKLIQTNCATNLDMMSSDPSGCISKDTVWAKNAVFD